MNEYLLHRRSFLAHGLGTFACHKLVRGERPAAADELVDPDAVKGPWHGVVRPLHHAPKVKRVIQLYMAGGPSHLETFDYKPTLAKLDGKPTPESYTKGQPMAKLQGRELRCSSASRRS